MKMKAMMFSRYGGVENLVWAEISRPVPKDDEVLVKIYAAAINDWDWCLVRGTPFYIRLLCGFWKPKFKIPGVDIAGTVEALGEAVKEFNHGDGVYGDLSNSSFGGFAEYVCVPAKELTLKSASMTFKEAAALPHAATLAWQGLMNGKKLDKTSRVLVNGAGGGVGTLAAQLLRSYGVTDITGVDSAAKVGVMQDSGFEKVLDYNHIDFTRTGERYDFILDTKTGYSPLAYLRALNPSGVYRSVGGQTPQLMLTALWGVVGKYFNSRRLHVLALKPNKGLAKINELYEAGALKPVIDPKEFTLKEVSKALAYFGEANHIGKIVITIH